MMMEPYDSIIDPLINNMSSEEEKYFNIPADRKVLDLKKLLKKIINQLLKLILEIKTVQAIFGLYQKIKKNLE